MGQPLEASATFRKWMVVLLTAGFAFLLLEIRFEHREVLGEKWQSYVPLVYSALMLPAGVLGIVGWERWGRRLLQLGFLLAFVTGALGVWFHSEGRPVAGLRRVLEAWSQSTGESEGNKPQSSGPPVMAPFAFVGLGSIGMLACGRASASSSK